MKLVTKVLVLFVIFATLLAVGCTGSADEETSSHMEESSSGTADEETSSYVEESSTPEPTSVQEYQDLEWMASVQKYCALIETDSNGISDAAQNSDFASIGLYAQYLVDDTQVAIEDNDKYTVSPSFEDAQKEWRLGLQNYNSAGQSMELAANEMENENYDKAVEYIEKATTFTNSGTFHLNRATAFLDTMQ